MDADGSGPANLTNDSADDFASGLVAGRSEIAFSRP